MIISMMGVTNHFPPRRAVHSGDHRTPTAESTYWSFEYDFRRRRGTSGIPVGFRVKTLLEYKDLLGSQTRHPLHSRA